MGEKIGLAAGQVAGCEEGARKEDEIALTAAASALPRERQVAVDRVIVSQENIWSPVRTVPGRWSDGDAALALSPRRRNHHRHAVEVNKTRQGPAQDRGGRVQKCLQAIKKL